MEENWYLLGVLTADINVPLFTLYHFLEFTSKIKYIYTEAANISVIQGFIPIGADILSVIIEDYTELEHDIWRKKQNCLSTFVTQDSFPK